MTSDKSLLLSFLQHDQRMRLKLMRKANKVKMAMDEKDGEKTKETFDDLYQSLEDYTNTHEEGLREMEEKIK